jgi:hypothetical protein
MMDIKSFFNYPFWVIVLVAVLLFSAILLLYYFYPNRDALALTRSNYDNNATYDEVRKENNFLWEKLCIPKCSIVIGSFPFNYKRSSSMGKFVDSSFEPSQLLGVGDAIALGELIGNMQKRNYKNYDIVPAYIADAKRRQGNLILIGGPDVNFITDAL